MPRFKQVKPQHINLEKHQGRQQPQHQAPEFTDVAPAAPVAGELGTPVNYVGTGDDMIGDQVPAKRPRREETHICEKCCGEFFSFSELLEHKKNCTERLPVFVMNDSEGLVPLEDFSGAVSSHQPQSSSSKDSHREDGSSSGDGKEKPGAESVLYLKKESTLPSLPQDLSYLPKGKVTSTNVTLQALWGTKVAVKQQSADALPASLPGANRIPSVLEQIFCLQKQQLQQIQLIEQIRIQMDMWATNTVHSGTTGADNLNTLGNRVSQPVSSAVASLSQKAGSQGLPLDTLKQARLPHTNIPPTTSSVSSGLTSSALRLDGSRVLPSRLSGTLLPETRSSVLFQSPCSTAPLDLSKQGKEKPPNMFPADVKSKNLSGSCKRVCKYCGRVFETDTSLQIHLCSHTGKKLFTCSICGHWFTSEGTLKEHFYQHLRAKENAQLLAEFHNRMAMGSGARCVRSVPVPVGESSLSLGSRPVLVPGTPKVGLPQNLFLVSNPKDLKSGPLAQDLHPRPSPEIEDGSMYSGVGPSHSSLRVGGFQGRGRPELGSQTLKLQQLVKNVDKATADPNECLICHRALSCQSSLRMHYRTHAEERPFRCTICDRAFSTKGSLKIHLGVHQTNTSVKTQYSCPICQKKFTNAVMLQQHIRMHMGGHIPNTPLPENPNDLAGSELMVVSESGSTSAVCHNDIECIDVDEVSSQDAPSSSSKVPVPLSSIHLASPTLGFTMVTPIDAPGKVSPAPVVLKQQSSRGKGSVKSGCLTNDSSSVMGDPQPQSRSPDVQETASFQGSQAEGIKYKSPDAGGKTERLESSLTEMEGWSSLPSDRAQPAYVKVEVSGASGCSARSPGMTPLLMARPGQQSKQYGCTWYRENHSSASALQIREQTRTRKKPFVCSICGQAFTTKGKLQVHYMTHVANNSSAHGGRKLAIENTTDLSGTDGKKLPEMFPQKIMAPSVSMGPVMGNQYTNMPNDGLATKTNKISVIKTVGISTPLASLGASPLVSNTTVSKVDSQRSQTPVPSLTGGKRDSGQLS
ncbi:spalt like transcription factor 4 [Phyllostomus discolor]|uniref:Sal-like protein 4 n=1 Tax=Phyllostomus discolor TaxID=89673 RepID=A0A7E6CZR8_9CHIR|nr:sal-like protein 4 [Phyllostomus discolor]KAF6091436.1 spalt like transcription factor 4 [Phyllostomus discolor]